MRRLAGDSRPTDQHLRPDLGLSLRRTQNLVLAPTVSRVKIGKLRSPELFKSEKFRHNVLKNIG